MTLRWFAPWICLCAIASGCATYRAKPLSAGSVGDALAYPGADALRIRSADLHHPAMPGIVVDLSDGLSPDEAAVIAVLLNPGLRAERDRRALADAQVLQARVLPNPELSYSRDIPIGTPGATSGFSTGLAWGVNELLTRRGRVAAARAGRESVALDVAWAEWQVAEAAKTAVYDLAGLEERDRLATEAGQRLDESLALVRRATAAGLLTNTDLAAAESAAHEARATQLETRAALVAQRGALAALLGMPETSVPALQAGIALPEHVDTRPAPDLAAHVEERRLDLRGLAAGYASQEQALRAAVMGQFPRLSLGINRSRDTSDVATRGYSLAVELPFFDRNQGAIASETASRQKLFDEYAARLFEARADIAANVAAIAALDAQLDASRESVAAFGRLEAAYGAALAGGHASAIDYVSAWNTFQSARLQHLALRVQLEEARVRLELASGLYRVDAKDQP